MSFFGSLVGSLIGGGGGDTITNTSSSASDVDVEVSPVILNEIDLAPVDALVARIQQMQLASQAQSEARFAELAAGYSDGFKLIAAGVLAWLIIRKGKI